jgi:dihydropteroate synthase
LIDFQHLRGFGPVVIDSPRFIMSSPVWQTSRFKIDLTQPKVMAIVNLTPDSFSDGGQHATVSHALQHAQAMLAQGADILDIGGESSRPGAAPVSVTEELARVLPFLREALTWNVPISVDTSKPEVMQAALDLGADIINDIWALRQPGALQVVAQHASCGVCLMHMHREPLSMAQHPMEGDAVVQVKDFLAAQMSTLLSSGIQLNRIVLDPGIGFGKTFAQNLSLLSRQAELIALGQPLLAGWSRKGTLGKLTAIQGVAPEATQRVGASVAAALMAVQNGAALVRVHDVKETVQALRFWQAAKI